MKKKMIKETLNIDLTSLFKEPKGYGDPEISFDDMVAFMHKTVADHPKHFNFKLVMDTWPEQDYVQTEFEIQAARWESDTEFETRNKRNEKSVATRLKNLSNKMAAEKIKKEVLEQQERDELERLKEKYEKTG